MDSRQPELVAASGEHCPSEDHHPSEGRCRPLEGHRHPSEDRCHPSEDRCHPPEERCHPLEGHRLREGHRRPLEGYRTWGGHLAAHCLGEAHLASFRPAHLAAHRLGEAHLASFRPSEVRLLAQWLLHSATEGTQARAHQLHMLEEHQMTMLEGLRLLDLAAELQRPEEAELLLERLRPMPRLEELQLPIPAEEHQMPTEQVT